MTLAHAIISASSLFVMVVLAFYAATSHARGRDVALRYTGWLIVGMLAGVAFTFGLAWVGEVL